MQKWSNNSDILMYSNYNKDQSLVDERFIRTLKGKIYIKKLLLKIAPVAMSIKILCHLQQKQISYRSQKWYYIRFFYNYAYIKINSDED